MYGQVLNQETKLLITPTVLLSLWAEKYISSSGILRINFYYSTNGSGRFVGVAKMTTEVDYEKIL